MSRGGYYHHRVDPSGLSRRHGRVDAGTRRAELVLARRGREDYRDAIFVKVAWSHLRSIGPGLLLSAGCDKLVQADFDVHPAPGPEPEMRICGEQDCQPHRSCALLDPECGPNEDQDCCLAFIIPGGEFDRDNTPSLPAKVSSFALDAYEVTVGRFRAFLVGYGNNWPSAGDGGLPGALATTGWQENWKDFMPQTEEGVRGLLEKCDRPRAWTPTAGINENRPVSCVHWYVAFAFCAWDGGRLPTEAEWSYAAAGGAEQRVYPWSVPFTSLEISEAHASYGCADRGACDQIASLINVGSKPAGNGRWGHADLAGNVWEWTLDGPGRKEEWCNDCIPDTRGAHRVVRGGGFRDSKSKLELGTSRDTRETNPHYLQIHNDLGFRCARDLQ